MNGEQLTEARMKLARLKSLHREVIELFKFCEIEELVDFESVGLSFQECERRLISYIESKAPNWTDDARKEIEKLAREFKERL
jgi:hypothetical protein